MGVVVTLMFLLLALVVGVFLMTRYHENTLGMDIRWLIGLLMVCISVFHLTAFVYHCVSWLVSWLM